MPYGKRGDPVDPVRPKPNSQRVALNDDSIAAKKAEMSGQKTEVSRTLGAMEVLQLQRRIGNHALCGLLAQGSLPIAIQRGNKKGRKKGSGRVFVPLVRSGEDIGGVIVNKDGYPRWDMENETWHLNVSAPTPHVTSETSPKKQYFFTRDGDKCKAVRPPRNEQGRNSYMFSSLPQRVQEFVQAHYSDLIRQA